MSNELNAKLGINSSEFDGVAVDMGSERATMAKARLTELCIMLNVIGVEYGTWAEYTYREVSPSKYQLVFSYTQFLDAEGTKVIFERSTMEELVYTIENTLGLPISDFRDYEGDAV